MGSKQYKIIDDLIKRGKPDSLYLLTGTPITNNPQNYYNLLKLIGDPITDDWKYYMERYCGAVRFPKNAEEKAKRNDITNNFVKSRGKYSWYDLTDEEKKSLNEIIDKNVKQITVAKDATNLEELRERTAHIYLRRLKEDLTDLNVKKNIHEVFYDFDVLQIMEYDRLWEEYENAQLELNPDKEINKELLEGAIYRKYCSNQMIPNTIKIVDSYVKVGRKVVIACCYDEELYTLKDHYGDSCVIFNGKMNQKEKLEAERLFRENDSKMILIGNIQAAGVGLNLVSASVMVFNNISFVPGEDYQMCDRIYRMGQTRDVDIYYQIFRNTQYEKMWNIVLRKSLVINQIVKKEDEK
jgi:SNF2 family DNA or RNA helicase